MRWLDWQPVYLDIVNRLNLDPAMDREATRLLTEILMEVEPNPLLRQLQEKIQGKTVVICGAGPSLETHLQSVMSTRIGSSFVYVAADGAVSALLNLDCKCSVITTDLDGNLDDIEEATGGGAVTIVHAHGDNMDKVREVVPKLGTVLGSTQVEPTERAFLWGGFTDGDRACHIVTDYSPDRIILAGMDFGGLVGKWSKPMHETHFPASKRKRIKLSIAKQLISSLIERTAIPFTVLK
ncbi:MAG: 6-hydroxymethyl-7,8-dihydropterin pyrophosphokinase [Candidatus Thorarchaeota archaeon]|nr:MAG: 6-hydroxymethyl-7,8-dihydropterin pyrophosphokinase [Candidatus Thorarchaeota archaeon]